MNLKSNSGRATRFRFKDPAEIVPGTNWETLHKNDCRHCGGVIIVFRDRNNFTKIADAHCMKCGQRYTPEIQTGAFPDGEPR